MHYRRLATFLLGAWLAGSFAMTLVATQNFRAVDRLLAAPGSGAAAIASLGQPAARGLLRHQASELNRFFFQRWEYAQLAIGAFFIYVLIVSHSSGRATLVLAFLMLAIVGVMRFYITPQVLELGRVMESLAPDPVSPQRTLFWNFHIAYSVLEVVKLVIGFAIAALLILPGRAGARATTAGSA